MTIRELAKKFFPHLLPKHREALSEHLLRLRGFIPLLFALALLAGCATKNPSVAPGTPAFIPPPWLNAASNTVATIAQATAPANPFARLTEYGISFGFGLAALIAGVIAKKKNDAADALAATVVKGGLQANAIDEASNTGALATVAAHLANNT